MKINDIFEGDVIQGPWDQKLEPKILNPQTATRISFGGREELIIRKMIHFEEKPSGFYDVMKYAKMPQRNLGLLQNKIGRKLNTYPITDLIKRMPAHPLDPVDISNLETTFLVYLDNDVVNQTKDIQEFNQYTDKKVETAYFLCNTSGAMTYIRNWAYIDPNS